MDEKAQAKSSISKRNDNVELTNSVYSYPGVSCKSWVSICAFCSFLYNQEKSQNTIDTYKYSLIAFFRQFDDVNRENVLAFKRFQMEQYKPRTVNIRISALNDYCRYIGKPECCVNKIRIQTNGAVENIPTKDEYFYFLDCLKTDGHEKQYWIVRFMASTGVRASELVSLEKHCLISGEFQMFTKGKVRTILIPESLIIDSKEYFKTVDSNYLFPSANKSKMTTHAVAVMLKRYGEKYHMRPEIMHPHSFRHLFAILFLEQTNNLTLLSNLMGHESIKTTSIYLQMPYARQKEVLNQAVNW